MTATKHRRWMALLAGALLGLAGCALEPDIALDQNASDLAGARGEDDMAPSEGAEDTDWSSQAIDDPGVEPELCVAPAPADFAHDAFDQTWRRGNDGPKDWGPVMTGLVWERYAQAPGGYRQVQYFEKARMEINNPGGVPSELWFVTTGHLVREMIRGEIQVGHDQWEKRDRINNQPRPADIQIAGDPDLATNHPLHGSAPTYASLSGRQGAETDRSGQIDKRLFRDGHIENAPGAPSATYGGHENQHNLATLFENHREGIDARMNVDGAGLHLVGYAITDPYWVRVPVGNVERWVLVQAFERRVMTYTPDNPDGWKIEMGNVGLHYMRWRYSNNAIVEGRRRGDFVTVKNGHFLLDGKPFRHVGVNMSEIVYYSAAQVSADLDALGPLNIRHIRVFLPNDTYDTPGMVARLRNILDQADARGVKVTVVLAQNYYQPVWPDPPQEEQGPHPPTNGRPRFFPRGDGGAFKCYPDGGAPNDGCGTNNLLSSEWFAGDFRGVYRNYVRDVVTALRDHRAVFAWEIANEVKDPHYWEDGHQARFLAFYEEMAQLIKDIDSDHLVAAGLISSEKAALAPGDPSSYFCNSRQCAEIFFSNPNIDYLSVHTYNDDGGNADRELARKLHKPWVVEEVGFCVTLPPGDRDDCTATKEPEYDDPQHEMAQFFDEAYKRNSQFDNVADAVMVWGVHFGTLTADRRYGPSEQDEVRPGQLAKYREMWRHWGAALNVCNGDEQGQVMVTSPGDGQRVEASSQQNITWTTSDPSISQVAIEVHDGSRWNTVAHAPNTGVYAWSVPSVSTDRAFVRVSDVRDTTRSDLSSAFTIGEPLPQVPLRVVLPTAESIFPVGRRIELKFQAPAGRIGVFYQSSPSDPWPTHLIGYVDVQEDDPNAIYLISWLDVPPSPTMQYRIVLWIEGSDGKDAAYSPFAWTSQVLVPTAPSEVAVTATSTVSMRVDWRDNSSDEAYFEIERRKQSEATFVSAGAVGANVTSYTAGGLEPGVSYCFRVKAVNGHGTAYSSESCGPTHSNGAAFVSQSVPATMVGGRQYTVSITMRNTGTVPWNRDGATPYRLGSQPQDSPLWVATRATLPVATVAPGGLATFTFTVTAPSTPGTYPFQWRMVQDLVQWFGPVTPAVTVNVTPGVTPLYAANYLRNWPTGDGQRTQWSELFINNPNDAPALVTIRIHKRTGGVHAVVQLGLPARGAWNSYGQPAWLGVPFTTPNADPTKNASSGWIEVGSDVPVIATGRTAFRTGNTYDSPAAIFQDEVLGHETSGTLYGTLYLKNWPSSAPGQTQWSSLVLVNPGCCAAANVTINVHKADGTGLLGSLTQSIAPGAVYSTYGLSGWIDLPDGNPHVGWVEVMADRPIFGSNRVTTRNGSTHDSPVALFQDEPLSGVTATHTGATLFLKNWPHSGSARQWSSVVLVNPGATNATATIRVHRTDGTVLATLYKNVPARGWWNSYGDVDWNAVPNTDPTIGGAVGWVDVTSTLPVFGLSRKRVTDGSTLVSTEDEPITAPPTTTGYASLYLKNWPSGTAGNTQWSQIAASNPQASATTLTVNVYGMNGALLKTFQKSLPAFGWWSSYGDADWLSVPATGSFGTGPGSLGWTEVIASQPVRAMNRVSLRAGNTYSAPVVQFHDVELVTKQP